MFSPVDNNQGNVSQLVQMSSLINRTTEVECHLLEQISVVEGGAMSSLLCFYILCTYMYTYHNMIFASYNLCDSVLYLKESFPVHSFHCKYL